MALSMASSTSTKTKRGTMQHRQRISAGYQRMNAADKVAQAKHRVCLLFLLVFKPAIALFCVNLFAGLSDINIINVQLRLRLTATVLLFHIKGTKHSSSSLNIST